MPIEDPSKGLVAQMIAAAVSIFPSAKKAAAIAAMEARVRALGTPTSSVAALNALLKAEAELAHRDADRLGEILPRGLVFADSNWGDGDHMTHFSMVVNPLSDPPAVEMWQMNEDGSAPRPMGEDWIKGSNWRVYADPDKYKGVTGGHEVTTAGGQKMQWEAYRAELQAKLNDCVAAKKGDLAKLRRILDVADARYAASDFAAADTALKKLAEELAPVAKMAAIVAQGVRALEAVAGAVSKEVEARRQKAKEQKLKTPTPQMKEVFAAAEVLGDLIVTLRSGINTPQELAKFVADRRDVLDYIDTQSPLGAANVVTTLTQP